MNVELDRCPSCGGKGYWTDWYRSGQPRRHCGTCKGTGRIVRARETNAESVRSSAWLGELEAAHAHVMNAMEKVNPEHALTKSHLCAAIDSIEEAIDTERRRSPSDPSSPTGASHERQSP